MFDLLAATLYQPLYLLIIMILMFLAYQKYRFIDKNTEFSKENVVGTILVVLFFIFFIGMRPVSTVFNDMGAYDLIYKLEEGHEFTLNRDAENRLFDNIFSWWSAKELGITSFFLFIATIYFGAAFLGIRRLFPHHTLMAYLVFLGAFSTFSYATNGIKAGAAASIFIWAISYRQRPFICIPLMLISWGFHHSMVLPIAAYIITVFFKNPYYYYIGWSLCFLISLLHINYFSNFFSGYADERGAEYLLDTLNNGFRLDFILYSAVPILIGYLLQCHKRINVSSTYSTLINLYTTINGVWLLCMYASFTNRIAYLSWFLYPIVLIYPFLYENWGPNKYTIFKKIIIYQFGFTVFMELIYYGNLIRILGL